MAGLLDLPPECIIHILSLLALREIARCRLISRDIWATINNSTLQYLLEVECLGLVPLHTTSDGLPLDAKVRALKEKRRMMNSDDASDSEVILLLDMFDLTGLGSRGIHAYSRGVLVVKGNEDTLGIYQLSSRNRKLESAHYVFQSLPTHTMVAIEPTFDLLLLFQGGFDTGTFHLHSLRTGLPHPKAALPTVTIVDYEDNVGTPLDSVVNRISIIGHHVAYTKAANDLYGGMVTVWNWVSGQTITSTWIINDSLSFLSEDIFIVGRPIENNLHPSLVLYTHDGALPEGQAPYLASFVVPEIEGLQLRWALFLPSPLPSVWHNGLAVASPPLIYDLYPTPPYLFLEITFATESGDMRGMLFMDSSRLLALASSFAAQWNGYGVGRVPWSDWKSTARWVGPADRDATREYGPAVFGHLAVYMHADEQLRLWWVEVYDLRTSVMKATSSSQPGKTSRLSRDQKIESAFNCSPEPIPSPTVVKSFAVPFDTIYWEANSLNDLVNLMIDDEHIVILEPKSRDGQSRLHIYPL